MGLLKRMSGWINRRQESELRRSRWREGLEACKEGETLLFREKKKEREALPYFDRAIECGYDGVRDVHGSRGLCLQGLGFHLDAIDDFGKAIAARPEDANWYFLRSLSRSHIGDFDGAIADMEEAVRLSKADNENNDYWNNYAKETGWPSATAYYENWLDRAQEDKTSKLAHVCAEKCRERESSSWRRTRQAI
jgi:tetratricopeptide (TPR) repeat protein